MKHNWNDIKTEYVTTKISTRALARKFGVSPSDVAKRCSREKWVEERSKFRDEVVSKAVQNQVIDRAEIVRQELLLLDKLDSLMDKILADPLQFNRHLVTESKDGIVTTVEKVFDKLDARSLKDVAQVLSITIRLRLQLSEVLTAKEQLDVDLMKTRMEVEKIKYDILKQKSESTAPPEIRVIMTDELRSWAK